MPQCQWPVTKAVLEDMIDPKNSLTTKTSPGISDNASSNFQNMKIKIFVFNALSLVSDSCSKNLLPSQFWISEEHDRSCSSYKNFFGFSLFFRGEHKNPNPKHEQCTSLSYVQSLFSYLFFVFFILFIIKLLQVRRDALKITASIETKLKKWALIKQLTHRLIGLVQSY